MAGGSLGIHDKCMKAFGPQSRHLSREYGFFGGSWMPPLQTPKTPTRGPPATQLQAPQRLHVALWYIHRPTRGYHNIITLGSMYIPYSYMEPLGTHTPATHPHPRLHSNAGLPASNTGSAATQGSASHTPASCYRDSACNGPRSGLSGGLKGCKPERLGGHEHANTGNFNKHVILLPQLFAATLINVGPVHQGAQVCILQHQPPANRAPPLRRGPSASPRPLDPPTTLTPCPA